MIKRLTVQEIADTLFETCPAQDDNLRLWVQYRTTVEQFALALELPTDRDKRNFFQACGIPAP